MSDTPTDPVITNNDSGTEVTPPWAQQLAEKDAALSAMTLARDAALSELAAANNAKTDAEQAALTASNQHAAAASQLASANSTISSLNSQLASAQTQVQSLQSQLATAQAASGGGTLTNEQQEALAALVKADAAHIAKLEWLVRQYGVDNATALTGLREAIEAQRGINDADFSATLAVQQARVAFQQAIADASNTQTVLNAALAYAAVLLA